MESNFPLLLSLPINPPLKPPLTEPMHMMRERNYTRAPPHTIYIRASLYTIYIRAYLRLCLMLVKKLIFIQHPQIKFLNFFFLSFCLNYTSLYSGQMMKLVHCLLQLLVWLLDFLVLLLLLLLIVLTLPKVDHNVLCCPRYFMCCKKTVILLLNHTLEIMGFFLFCIYMHPLLPLHQFNIMIIYSLSSLF